MDGTRRIHQRFANHPDEGRVAATLELAPGDQRIPDDLCSDLRQRHPRTDGTLAVVHTNNRADLEGEADLNRRRVGDAGDGHASCLRRDHEAEPVFPVG